jgi:hypothetical protein
VASLGLSAISLGLPDRFGLLGPLAAGVLAFLGYRRVRASGGRLRGPLLAKVAMSAALLLFVAVAWVVVRRAPEAAAAARLQAQSARVEALLRTGTPEGAWELLSPEGRTGADRAAFVRAFREAMLRLGPLDSLGPPLQGGGWEGMAGYREGASADLRLGWAFDARFARGPGRVEIEVRLRREGSAVSADLVGLRLLPRGP